MVTELTTTENYKWTIKYRVDKKHLKLEILVCKMESKKLAAQVNPPKQVHESQMHELPMCEPL